MSVQSQEWGPLGELDRATERDGPGYVTRVYRDAAEATVQFLGRVSRKRVSRATPDPAKNGRDAANRARREMRRYVVANRLRVFVTLTFNGDAASEEECHKAMKKLLRTLRSDVFGGQPFPWLYVLERGDNGRLHVHLVTPAVCPVVFVALWRLGKVETGWLRSIEERRATATYLAKEFDRANEPGRRRYRAGSGAKGAGGQFRPEDPVVSTGFDTRRDALEEAACLFGRQPDSVASYRGYLGEVQVLRWGEDDALRGDWSPGDLRREPHWICGERFCGEAEAGRLRLGWVRGSPGDTYETSAPDAGTNSPERGSLDAVLGERRRLLHAVEPPDDGEAGEQMVASFSSLRRANPVLVGGKAGSPARRSVAWVAGLMRRRNQEPHPAVGDGCRPQMGEPLCRSDDPVGLHLVGAVDADRAAPTRRPKRRSGSDTFGLLGQATRGRRRGPVATRPR